MKSTAKTLAVLIASAVVAAACGGGGGDTPAPAPTPPVAAPTPATPAPAPAPTPQTFKVMAVGDSITQGDCDHVSYRRSLQQKLAADAQLAAAAISFDFVGRQTDNFNLINTSAACPAPSPAYDLAHEGYWGKRADEVAALLQSLTVANAADVALIHVGSNDVFQSQTSDSTITDIGLIITRLRALNPTVRILVAQVVPSTQIGATGLGELNAKIALLPSQLGTTASPIVAVDQSTGFVAATDTWDGTHPNASGEDKLAARWAAAIKAAVL